jgi:two-component system, sensor histidine kinase and response regulator
LIDRHMPGMDGEALGRAIKADPELRETALVLLTATAGWGNATQWLAAGFSAVLAKPVRQAQLRRALDVASGSPEGLLSLDAMLRPGSPAEPLAALPLQPGNGMRRARVLVAEDNVVNQRVVTVMLEKLGCAVDLATNGKQAVEMVAAVPYEVVFMDCQMPEMDGLEATAEIRRRQGGGCHTPIIALTASARKDDQDRCLAAGMDGYMSKPLKSSDLRDALVRWLATPVAAALEKIE